MEKYESKLLISEIPTLSKRCARGKALNLSKNIYKLKGQSYILFATNEWVVPAASTIKSEERKFLVDSGASMHVVSKRDLNSAELETMRISKNPTTVMTANGEVQTRERSHGICQRLGLIRNCGRNVDVCDHNDNRDLT